MVIKTIRQIKHFYTLIFPVSQWNCGTGSLRLGGGGRGEEDAHILES